MENLGGEFLINKKFLLLFICCLVASMGVSNAIFTGGGGDSPTTLLELFSKKIDYGFTFIATDGSNIYLSGTGGVDTPDGVFKYDESGHLLWHQNITSPGAIFSGKYLYVGCVDHIVALNKTNGAVVWDIPISGYICSIRSKGNFVLAWSDINTLYVLDANTGNELGTVAASPNSDDVAIINGKLFVCADGNLKAYKLIEKPDLIVKKITKQSNGLKVDISNIGLANANKVLVKFVVQKTDGSYKVIHINAGTVNAGETKTLNVYGSIKKGYVIIDPYYSVPELNEKNNQLYFY